jgi:hypothetical protein
MRLLKFNNELVDIDEDTAIGITYQGYDIQTPGERKVAISNNFSIPATSYNLRLVGFAGNPQSLSQTAYDLITCQYYNDNQQLIKNGSVRITKIENKRIYIFVYEKDDFWAQMGQLEWPDFLDEFITWMQAEKSLPSASSPFVGTFQEFIDEYIDADTVTEGLFLPFFISNLSKYEVSGSFLEDTSELWIKYQDGVMSTPALGGHFCIYCKTIFEFIEYKYDVDLSVLSEDYDYNIFEDAVASVMYTPARNISIEYTATGFYFSVDTQGQFLPTKNAEDKNSKSLYDFTKAFFQHFNCLIDKIPTPDLSIKYVIRRFDDITNAPVIDFSGGMSGEPSFKPILENYKQSNYITFSDIYEGGSELTNAKSIVCLNKNIDAGGPDNSIFSIDSYIPGSIVVGGDVVPDLSEPDSFKTFEFFISDTQASVDIKASENADERTASVILYIARSYSLASEYTTIESMVEYPVFYEISKYLTLEQMGQVVFFARYWIKELNGYYFMNKISGYNPQKSNEATRLELIKIPT